MFPGSPETIRSPSRVHLAPFLAVFLSAVRPGSIDFRQQQLRLELQDRPDGCSLRNSLRGVVYCLNGIRGSCGRIALPSQRRQMMLPGTGRRAGLI